MPYLYTLMAGTGASSRCCATAGDFGDAPKPTWSVTTDEMMVGPICWSRRCLKMVPAAGRSTCHASKEFSVGSTTGRGSTTLCGPLDHR